MTNRAPSHGQIFVWDKEDGNKRLERPRVDAFEMARRFPERYTLHDPEQGRGATAPEAAAPPDPGTPIIPGLPTEGTPKEHSPGVPLNATPSAEAGEAKPLDLPPEASGAKPKGKK